MCERWDVNRGTREQRDERMYIERMYIERICYEKRSRHWEGKDDNKGMSIREQGNEG